MSIEPAPDDVDRLFARLERVEPPPDLQARILETIAARARARRRIGRIILAPALVLIATFSFLAGRQLSASGALVLADAVRTDLDLVLAAPVDVALATIDLIPWAHVGAVALGILLLAYGGSLMLQPDARFRALDRDGGWP
ncbi:MAG TPA: hypothetical protein VFC51_13845 [Chloroflexota bacterium]|nr:hypothetical protein [Chloroflexota bacterium]